MKADAKRKTEVKIKKNRPTEGLGQYLGPYTHSAPLEYLEARARFFETA